MRERQSGWPNGIAKAIEFIANEQKRKEAEQQDEKEAYEEITFAEITN